MSELSIDNKVTSGPIPKTIFALAMPVVLNMIMQFALTSIDYFWVGKLGATAQDAVTSSMVVIWTIFVIITIITIGVTALISRYVGAGDFDKAVYYIRQGTAFAIYLSLTLTIVGYLATPPLLLFMETGEATFVQASPYLRIFFLSAIFFFMNDTLYAVFRASGDTKTPTLVGITTVILNMVLDPILIFGFGPIPAMGVVGASLATTISIVIGTILIVAFLMKGKLSYPISKPFTLKADVKEILRIAKIGLPMATQQMVFVIVYWFIIRIVHDFGEAAGAAMGIGNRMESFSYLTCHGFSVAAATMVGQNLGANKPERAARCAWGAIGLAVLITSVITVLFIVLPKSIVSIFSDDPEVIAMAVDYLIILGISQTTMAIEIVLEGAFSGAGDTIPPMVVMIPGSLARIPLAYFLVYNLGWGLNGVWWTMTITTLVKSLILAYWFKRGKWQLKVL